VVIFEYHRSFWFEPHGTLLYGNTTGDLRKALRSLQRAREALVAVDREAREAEEGVSRAAGRQRAEADVLPPGVRRGYFRMTGRDVEAVVLIGNGCIARWLLTLESRTLLRFVELRVRDPPPAGPPGPVRQTHGQLVVARDDSGNPLSAKRAPLGWRESILPLFHPVLWADEESIALGVEPEQFDLTSF
jgi:hypothetical protein